MILLDPIQLKFNKLTVLYLLIN
uniref:Uncharacterized protein n=1 Tax=Arundo donax TaxID=35708 RepID=A0A0A9C9H6_ARUDO